MNDPNFSLMDVVLPVGAVTAFVGDVASYQQSKGDTSTHTTAPIEAFGWMLCDGSSLKASEYPELYSALGDLYGSSGSGKDLEFNLPDLRGQFLRGIGTDKASIEDRTKAPGGKEDGVGSTQKDALQKHQHVYTKPTGTPAPGESAEGTATVNTEAYTGPPTSETDKSAINVSQYETRPVNVFVNYLIKYTYKLPKFNHFPQV
ncbi:tail fiber protein [Aquimarina rhabdastrellae]